MQQEIGVKITSIGLSIALLLGSPVVVRDAYAAENPSNDYSFNISYIKDESIVQFDNVKDIALYETYKNTEDSKVVKIPESIESQVRGYLKIADDEEITVGDLRTIKLLIISSHDNQDMSWLNYCSNLETLFIDGSLCNNLDSVVALDNLKLATITPEFGETLDLKKCAFLKYSPKLANLGINGSFTSDYLYELSNIRDLSFDVIHNQEIDFKRLAFLDKLVLSGQVYDIAMMLSNEDLAFLESNGVKVECNDSLDKVLER